MNNLEQRHEAEDLERRLQEAEETMKAMRMEMFNNEEHMTRLMEKEKENLRAWIAKYEREEDKNRELQVEIINFKQKIEVHIDEKYKQRLSIEEMEKYCEKIIKA